jgi:hypothetical protein
MNDQTVTPEQRAAVEWLRRTADDRSLRLELPPEVAHARSILSALPASLTDPVPALPTEPGVYTVDPTSVDAWIYRLYEDGQWMYEATRKQVSKHDLPIRLTRLVPERPQITIDELHATVRAVGGSLSAVTAHAIMQLVNGTERD